MAQQVKLKAQKRSVLGRNAVKKIKKEGLVPGIVYGSQSEPMPLQVEARELANVLAHASSEHVLVELEIADGSQSTNRLALIQEVQHHPLRRELLHVDFHAVSRTEKIISEVPIEAFGEALGVRTFGGLLEYSLRTLEVECFPQDLPDIVRIDVTNLNIGESLHVRDIPLPPGVEAITDGDLTVASVVASRVGEEVTEAAETVTTPEVITEKKGEAKTETSQS
ncbi:MAG: 50S ribosomal protein L25/general stress protein Ctc [Verrucomicrobia bacterium]|nr:50S ribosomal protein L25/general stress protein Ctc [Verrucomicrobiota bacterium]MBV8377561.1 50S ribosomal protein L25/general stress protein Ctc [Verrucomicrobiota bacterium]